MKSFKKNYIGKGKEVDNLDILKVTLKFKDLEQYFYEFKGYKLLTFELSALKKADDNGRTHTAYFSVLKEEEVPEEKKR